MIESSRRVTRTTRALLLGGMAVVAPVLAGELTIPNVFTANTPARAAQVNGNFEAVKGAVDDNDQRLTALQAAVDALAASLTCSPDTPARFTDNGDGTICDSETGLMWEKKLAADGTEGGNCAAAAQADRSARCVNNTYNWTDPAVLNGEPPDGPLFTDFLSRMNLGDSAASDASTIIQAGYTDWRIPNVVELRSILLAEFPDCPGSPCIDEVFGPTQTASAYWSSSSFTDQPEKAFAVGFGNGDTFPPGKPSAAPVRAVRGGR